MYHIDPKTNREIYEYNPFDKRYIYKKVDDVQILAKDEHGNRYYASDDNGQEYYPKVFGDEEYTNQIHYIKDLATDREIYPIKKFRNGRWKQVYDSELKYARDYNNNQYYAKDENGDEYPFGSTYAKNLNEIEMYPKDRDLKEFYIKDSDNNDILAKSTFGEYYATTDYTRLETVYPKTSTGEEFYAKWDGKEIYGFKKQYPLQLIDASEHE